MLLMANLSRQQLLLHLALPRPRLDPSRKRKTLRGRRRRCRLLWTTKLRHQASGSRYILLF
jgi:hypothetical protein